jgi:hypothetical protein
MEARPAVEPSAPKNPEPIYSRLVGHDDRECGGQIACLEREVARLRREMNRMQRQVALLEHDLAIQRIQHAETSLWSRSSQILRRWTAWLSAPPMRQR